MDLIRFQPPMPENSEELAQKMEELLIDFQVYHSNLKNIHWNGGLRPFIGLSQKIEYLYRLTGENQEHIADQMIQLGFEPARNAFLSETSLMRTNVSLIQAVQGFEDAIHAIIHTSRELLDSVKEVFYLAADMEEKGTMMIMGRLANQLQLAMAIFGGERLAMSN